MRTKIALSVTCLFLLLALICTNKHKDYTPDKWDIYYEYNVYGTDTIPVDIIAVHIDY